ncbi:MAG TPA: hypothetical protein VGA33_08925, partial [Thermoanaerobaculia bacterium]
CFLFGSARVQQFARMFPPDSRADIARVLVTIERSAWLSIATVAVILATSMWILFRFRRNAARRTAMHLVLNTVIAVTALLLVVLAIGAVNILVEPALILQTFYGVSGVPPLATTLAVLLTACALAAVAEAIPGRRTKS